MIKYRILNEDCSIIIKCGEMEYAASTEGFGRMWLYCGNLLIGCINLNEYRLKYERCENGVYQFEMIKRG